MGYFYPTLERNLRGAAFQYQDNLTRKLREDAGLPRRLVDLDYSVNDAYEGHKQEQLNQRWD